MGDEYEDEIKKSSVQSLKTLPFQIIPPRLQKGNREQIPEYLPKNNIENADSSQIMIVNKSDHNKGVRLGIQKVKNLLDNVKSLLGSKEEKVNQNSTMNLIGK